MSDFQESGISFKFSSPQWAVVKYDEHLAHKKVSNALQPTKAVDFLGIHDNRQLFLVVIGCMIPFSFSLSFSSSQNLVNRPYQESSSIISGSEVLK